MCRIEQNLLIRINKKMDKQKKKELDAQLSRLFAVVSKRQENSKSDKNGLRGAKVIRRRKGQPDRQVNSE